MKTDLAPKHLYYYAVLTLGLAIIIASVAHQSTMNRLMKADHLLPFIFTSTIWVALFLGLLLVINKCRYVTINPADENKFIMGNLLTHTHVDGNKLAIEKKIWQNLFKISVDGKVYYIFSFDRIINEFKRNK